jgi:hypothetical protein
LAIWKRIEEKLPQSVSHTISTSYIERTNGTLRQMDSHLRRKSLTLAKEKPCFEARPNIIIFVYNFIRPHNTLCKNPDKTRTARTPALVAGIDNALSEQCHRQTTGRFLIVNIREDVL